jgi:hypothetical protein
MSGFCAFCKQKAWWYRTVMEPIPGIADESGTWGPVAIGVGVFLAIVGIAAAAAYVITTGDVATPIQAASGIAANTTNGGFGLMNAAVQTFATGVDAATQTMPITPASVGSIVEQFASAMSIIENARSPNEIPTPAPVELPPVTRGMMERGELSPGSVRGAMIWARDRAGRLARARLGTDPYGY